MTLAMSKEEIASDAMKQAMSWLDDRGYCYRYLPPSQLVLAGRRGLEVHSLRDPLKEPHTSHIVRSSKAQRSSVAKADRLEAGGFNLVMCIK